MAAVTQMIPTYLGGISKQIDSKKKPGQVRECLNAYPDPTLGLIKRPGTKYIKTLATTSLTDAKWFYIHRDGDEQYIGRISKGTPGNIEIWNALTGVECTVNDHTFTMAVDDPAVVYNLTVTNTTPVNWEIDSGGVAGDRTGTTFVTEDDPTLEINIGDSIHFTNNTGSEPFWIKTVQGPGTVNPVPEEWLEGSNGITTGTLVFTPRAAGTYYYNHQTNAAMTGLINVTGEGSNKRNVAIQAGAGQGTNGTGMTVNIVATHGKITDVYTCTPGSGYLVNDTLKVLAADAGVPEDVTFTITSIGTHYLQASGSTEDNPQQNYDVLTVQDTTIITNKTTPIRPEEEQSYTANKKATVRLKQVRYGSKYNVKINGSETVDIITIMSDPASANAVLNSDDILDQLVTNIGTLNIAGMQVERLPSSLELSCSSPFTIEAIDDAGQEHLETFQEQVNLISDLPNQCAHGRLIKVINTEKTDEAAYWAKFKTEPDTNGVHPSIGPGFWEETVDPNVSTGLLNSTMPHELFNPTTNVFDYQGINWKDRLVGDDTTNEHPSFCNPHEPTTIQQCFLYNTRLGFLTKDNVSLSQAQDYYNFYFTTALTSLPSDPIDLSCSSVRPAVLHGVVPTAQGLVLFSKNQQFIMFAADGPLTPATAIIRSISNYEMDTKIDPVDVGTNINFVSKTPSYSRIFGMQTRGYEESPIIQDISRAVTQWIPEAIDSMLSSPQNSLTGVYGKTLDKLYLYRVYAIGKEELMQSWFEWKLPGKIQYCIIDNDTMWTVVLNDTRTILLKSSISKSTTEDVIVTDSGLQVNPHMDMFNAASSVRYKDVKEIISVGASQAQPGYTSIPPVSISAPNDPDGVTATATAVLGTPLNDGTGRMPVTGFTITNPGSGYTGTPIVNVGTNWETNTAYNIGDQVRAGPSGGPPPQGGVYVYSATSAGTSGPVRPVHYSPLLSIFNDHPDGISGVNWQVMGFYAFNEATINEYDGSRCYLPYTDIEELNPVIVLKGSGVTESGFTIKPFREVDENGDVFLGVPKLNFSDQAADVYVGYEYNYDVELPKTYFKLQDESVDYAANLTIARMKFAVGLSSGVGFKLKSKGYRGESYSFSGTANLPTDTEATHTTFTVPFPLKEENGVVVKVDNAKQLASTAYSFTTNSNDNGVVTFKSGYVPTGHTPKHLNGGSGYEGHDNISGGVVVGSLNVPTLTNSIEGTGMTVDTLVDSSTGEVTEVKVADQGSGYRPDDVMTVTGGHIQAIDVDWDSPPMYNWNGSPTGGNPYTIVEDCDTSLLTCNKYTTNSVNGKGAEFLVTITGGTGVVQSVGIVKKGRGFVVGDTITISGHDLGNLKYGVNYPDPSDVVLTVTQVEEAATFVIDTLPADITITTDTWYDVQPVQEANQYLADDVPLVEENMFTIPIHQRTDNFNLRVFSNSPFPVSLNSMMWEGNYSRYYRRT